MAEKKKKLTPEQENHKICEEFEHSMFALLTDYLDIAPEKSKKIYDLVDKNICKILRQHAITHIHKRNYIEMFNFSSSVWYLVLSCCHRFLRAVIL